MSGHLIFETTEIHLDLLETEGLKTQCFLMTFLDWL